MVSSTVHKTLGGPRSGFILCTEELKKKIDSAVFPGQQGGPLMHVIAAKATAFKVAATEEFKDRQKRTIEGARILAERLTHQDMRDAGVPSPPTVPTCTWYWSICATTSSPVKRLKTCCTTRVLPLTATRCRTIPARRW